ncbi:MAG: hypothetical protein Q8N81_08505 [bacterium]|nr:hypothetical protein [bacterium]
MTKQDLLEISNLDDLRTALGNFAPTALILDEELLAHIARLCDGFWMHSGNPKQPHAILTSNLHSNGFLSGPKYLQYPEIAGFFAEQTIRKLPPDVKALKIDTVVGSAYAAITFAWEVARLLGARHIHTEKEGKSQALLRFDLSPGERVLRVEDLITTTSTVASVTEALVKRCAPELPNFAQAILTLVSRSAEKEYAGDPIYHGVYFNIENFDPATCPLCAAGSEAIRPRATPENWARLTAPSA